MKKTMLLLSFTFCIVHFVFPQPGEWVWIHGSSSPASLGNFGVQGVPSPLNEPPAVYEPCEWTDLNGNFWIYGGWGSPNRYAALWKYDPLTNEWVWMKGPSTGGFSGSYGIQGVPSPSNNPPGNSHGALSWTDNQNNLWMFGGGNSTCALWRYTIATNEWTWMQGPNGSSQAAVYGTQGVPDPANNPGHRWECAAAWTDDTDNLWLFGGTYNNTNLYNDMWRYNISANVWTWMKGAQVFNQPGIYGTQGIEDSLNTPGGRIIFSRWKDKNGNLWLFGGGDNGNFIYQNDLWRFNPSTNNWTWMNGSNTPNATSIYGTQCIASANNTPGARFENRVAWTDLNGNFWMFGGGTGGPGGSFANVWNDLWMYCVATNKWIWVSGDNIPNTPGNWGILGVSDPANKPNGRAGAVGGIDLNQNLYLFGGSPTGFNTYNDLWKFSIDTTCGTCPVLTGAGENNPPEADELLVFPNPANSSLTISFSSSGKQTIELRIYNTLSKHVYFSKEEAAKGKFEKEINVENLGDGIYFLQLKTKEEAINRKIIINH